MSANPVALAAGWPPVAVGPNRSGHTYRVECIRGTQFQISSVERLQEYMVNEFPLGDERLNRGGGRNRLGELLRRVDDTRSSEKVFSKNVSEPLQHELFNLVLIPRGPKARP